eukprot:g5770.t1
MPVDELIDQLASLTLRAGPAVKEGTSEKLEYKNRGEHAVKQLQAHLTRVRSEIRIAEAGSPKALADAAKQEGKGLLKIAQAGLRNTTGGLEPLRLAYGASRALLPLSHFIVAADLTMERLWYKVASRSVELGDYELGLCASACLQTCLDQRNGGDLMNGAGGVGGEAGCSVGVGSEGEEGGLRLSSFAPPGASCSVALAKLMSGASLNACRCCLEVGTRDTLRLMTGELSRSASGWIDRVGELGDDATADSYRGLLFKQLWLGCAALEKPGLAATSRECLRGRQAALGVLLRKEDSWKPDVFVAHAFRAAVALQERADSFDSDSKGASTSAAAELSAFCLQGLSDREGEGWPAEVDGGGQEPEMLHSSWVDWLQHSAGLHQKVGQAAEAQGLLQLAYEYVQRCRKRLVESGRDHRVAECAAHAGILKLHTAAMLTSLEPPDGAAASASPLTGKQAPKKRAGKKSAESPKPSSAVLALTSRGLDYLGDVVAALEALAGGEDGARREIGAETTAFIGAAVKAWTRAKKSCAVVALWLEQGAGGVRDSENPAGREHSESTWSALSVRGRLVLAELSLKLALLREKKALGRVLERLPQTASLFQLAVDSYIRVAHAHLGTLNSASESESRRVPSAIIRNARTMSPGTVAAEDARQALTAAEKILEVAGDVLPSPVGKRVGTGWFGLGTALLDREETDAGLDALVRGCRLLESWTEAECDRQSRNGAGGDSSVSVLPGVLRSVQLDMRLAKLSVALQDSFAWAMAAAAAARALTFCPGMWCFSAEGEGQPEPPAGARALVERFVTCKLRCGGPADLEPGSAAGEGRVASATTEPLSAYLSDGANLPTALEKRGFPPVAIVWVLVAVCRVYRAHLRRCLSEQAGFGTSEDEEEETENEEEAGQDGALLACVEGHRLATDSILGICASCRKGKGIGGSQNQADMWEAHARLLAAKFEHDLHLANATVKAIDDDSAAGVSADLSTSIQHATCGVATASRLGGSGEGADPGSPVAAATGGVLACVRAMLHRAVSGDDDDAKTAMRESLDLFDRAARDPEWRPELSPPANFGPAGVGSITDSLGSLEAHYTLHGDTLRRAKVGEIRLVLADRAGSETEKENLPQGLASSAAALGCIGTAFQSGGFPGLGPAYCAAANEEMSELAGERRRWGAGAVPDGRTDGAGSSAKTESVRVAVDILRGMCLAERSGGRGEGESVLLEARRAVSAPDSRVRIVAPLTAAYLECVAGLGLSWTYERSGRLVEAMEEARQVMRLCRTWASAGGPLVVADKQVVALSAEKGGCIHDAGSDGLAAGASEAPAEEGIGAEGGDTEGTMGDEGSDAGGRKATLLPLGSRWIPVYLGGLTSMGRLWRERGMASKASLTLRQGCVMSESLHAARFLRNCLLEEVEVATGKHQFGRAERLLRASQELLLQERREMASASSSASSADCTACEAPDPARTAASGTTRGSAAKGQGSKRAPKKPGGRKKPSGASPMVVVGSEEGTCFRCRELAVDAAELAVVEASLLRKQGSFEEALAACERGQSILAPLVGVAGEPALWSGSLSFIRVSPGNVRADGADGNRLGWRAVEVLAMLRLQQGRACCLLGNTTAGEELLQDCSNADGAPALVRATAHYRMGRMYLDVGDAAGARLPLEKSEVLCRGAGVPKLVRKVRRVLAVALAEVAGRGMAGVVGVDASWRVAALSSLSVGVTHCNQVIHAFSRRTRKGDSDGDGVPNLSAGMQLFGVVSGKRGAKVDGCALQEGLKDTCGEGCLEDAVTSDLRAEWPIISLCVAPGNGACRRLLLTRLVRGRPPLTLSVPLSPDDTQLLERWRGIMDENRDSLRGHSAEEAAKYGNQEKARWWERRVAVDEMVNDMLRELEERWLGAHGLAAVLLGDVVGEGAGLGLELEGVFEFAEERIRAARGGASAGKGASRTKGGKKPRGAVVAPAGDGGAEAKEGRSSAVSELIRVCVRGGEVMGEKAWLAVVRLALAGAGSESLAAEVSREIHEKARLAFAAGEVKFGRANTHAASAAVAGDSRWSPDSEIEKGRSYSSAKRAAVVQAAAAATSSASAASASGASMEEGTMSKMKVAELRRQLSSRGVPTTGLKLKSDLLAKLVEVVRGEADRNPGGVDVGGDAGPAASPAAKSAEGGDGSVDLGLSTPDGIGGAATAKTKGRGQTARTPTTVPGGNNGGKGSGGGVVGVGEGGRWKRHPVVLVLDEELQAIPWEGLPCLRGHAVTRVPAVPFVFAALETRWDAGSGDDVQASGGKCRGKGKGKGKANGTAKPAPARNLEQPWIPSRGGVRLNRGYYVLDPEANLPHTRKHLGPVFQGLGRRLGWSGVQGEAPSEETMTQTLEGVDIFAYCGHGAGELLVGRDAVAGLTKCAVAVLMGCSSGRLKGYGDFEPMGMATSYLAGGSPAVVANLWDVTDKDIDRFSVALIEAFLGDGEAGKGGTGRAATLAHAVAESRSECKMPFIIGYSPVCYGIPVTVAASPLS